MCGKRTFESTDKKTSKVKKVNFFIRSNESLLF
jgi:hypothetical protein